MSHVIFYPLSIHIYEKSNGGMNFNVNLLTWLLFWFWKIECYYTVNDMEWHWNVSIFWENIQSIHTIHFFFCLQYIKFVREFWSMSHATVSGFFIHCSIILNRNYYLKMHSDDNTEVKIYFWRKIQICDKCFCHLVK